VQGVATHPEDDVMLATAISGGVDNLVTGDRRLREVGSIEGIAILSPREFLDLLTSEDPPSS
jgi:predicted nucleic acid-binding protein